MPASGITYSQEFEWMEAAKWAGGSTVRYWQQFCALDGDDQARIVAHYRAHERMQAVIAQAVERKRKKLQG